MLEVTLTARQPLALGRHQTDAAPQESLSYVPGSLLRGALAAAWIRDHGLPARASDEKRAEFVALFESRTLYGPLFAAGSEVVPLSVSGCKYRGCPGVYADAAFGEYAARCTGCGGPMAGGRGEVRFLSGSRGVVERTHLEIDDDTGTAKDGMLFTRRALSHREADGSARTFHGPITTDALPESALAWLTTPRSLRVGGRRSTTGGVSYETRPSDRGLPPSGTAVALRLLAPAILTDAGGLPLDLADLAAVREALSGELDGPLGTPIASVERIWQRREHVGGWHAASRLPKPTELAVSAGSVLLLRFAEPPSREALAAVRRRGVGLRRNEGFGCVETAVSPWRPSVREIPEAAPERQEDLAEHYARTLYATGEGAWFRKQLRSYVDERNAGHDAHVGMLGLPRLKNLTALEKEQVTTLLHEPDLSVLDRTLTALTVLVELSKETVR